MTITDEQELRQLVTNLENAWNAGDSEAWTAQFAEDADFIHILGGHFTGQTAIERGHRAIFDTIYKGSTNQYTVQKIRPITSDVAVVFVVAELKVAQSGLPSLIQARPTLVARRLADGWKIVVFQNTLITAEGASRDNSLAQGINSALNDVVAEHHPIKGSAKASGN